MGVPQRPFEQPFEARRGEVERARRVQGSVYEVWGTVDVIKPGEGLVDVDFPVGFSEKPTISGAGELAEGMVLEDGRFPTWNVGVYKWKKTVRDGKSYYVGATLVLVVTGSLDMNSTVHWQMKGRALVNPATPS